MLLEGDKCGMARPADVVSVEKNLWISSLCVCVNGIGGVASLAWIWNFVISVNKNVAILGRDTIEGDEGIIIIIQWKKFD